MCRLFVSVSTSPVAAAPFLFSGPRSLQAQSHSDPTRKQKDGWGVGWYEDAKPIALKDSKPMYIGDKRVMRQAKSVHASTIVGHVRAASNPGNLPKNKIIGVKHTQPFTFQNYLFVHNGALNIPLEVKKKLGKLEKNVKGRNDSEVLFYWLVKNLSLDGKPEAIAAQVTASLKGLYRIWRGCHRRYPRHDRPYQGINFALSNGQRTVVLCHVRPEGFGKWKALQSNRPWYQLHIKKNRRAIVIASEPLDDDKSWRAVAHNQLFVIDRSSKRISLRREKISF